MGLPVIPAASFFLTSSEIRMRALILVAGAALALDACGNNDQADNTTNVDENLTAENIVSNDITAIDAVTGDAANMAADVDVSFTNETDMALDNATGSSSPRSNPSARPSPGNEAVPTNEVAANEAANATE
jgi:hypothetical protein